MKQYFVVESGIGTDGKLFANAYPCKSAQEAGEYATSLVCDQCQAYDIPFNDTKWEIEGDGWQYRVEVQEQDMGGLNEKETDLVVSIINLVAEDMGWDVDEEGFGYDPKTLELDVVSECDLEEALADLWEEYRTDYNQRHANGNEAQKVIKNMPNEAMCLKYTIYREVDGDNWYYGATNDLVEASVICANLGNNTRIIETSKTAKES